MVAGYFLACLVTLFEVFLGRYGAKMPRVLVALCFLAMGFGIATNIIGILAGRGGTGTVDYLIAIFLGLVLELFPERLYMFVAGVQSADLFDAMRSMFSTGPRRQKHRHDSSIPPFQPPANLRNRPNLPPEFRGQPKRQLDPQNPRRNGQS